MNPYEPDTLSSEAPAVDSGVSDVADTSALFSGISESTAVSSAESVVPDSAASVTDSGVPGSLTTSAVSVTDSDVPASVVVSATGSSARCVSLTVLSETASALRSFSRNCFGVFPLRKYRRERRTFARFVTSIRSIIGEYSGNIFSTAIPSEPTLRTVNVAPASEPCLQAITKPSKTCILTFPFSANF